METLFLTPSDDASEYTHFRVDVRGTLVDVAIACELVDRIAGERLAEAQRLAFIRQEQDLFATAAARKAQAMANAPFIELTDADFIDMPGRSGVTDALMVRHREELLDEALEESFPASDSPAVSTS